MIESDRRQRHQCLPQVEPLAILADYRDGDDAASPQRRQIADDRARRARVVTHAHYLIGVEPGFDARLVQGRIDVEIAVEEQVAEDADGEVRDALEDLLQSPVGQSHGALPFGSRLTARAAWYTAGTVIRWSPWT